MRYIGIAFIARFFARKNISLIARKERMECEICGRPATAKARIEGATVAVCASCGALGTPVVMAPPLAPARQKTVMRAPEVADYAPDFAARIRQAREARGLSRTAFARKIGEKETALERIERGARPEAKTASKIERALGIVIVTKESDTACAPPAKSGAPLTLGDIVTVTKKKRSSQR